MSTKYSVDGDKTFHLYVDIFDLNHVYLRLEGLPLVFSMDQRSMTLAIPFALWERLRAADVAKVRANVLDETKPAADPR